MKGHFHEPELVETPPHRTEFGFRFYGVALSPHAGRGALGARGATEDMRACWEARTHPFFGIFRNRGAAPRAAHRPSRHGIACSRACSVAGVPRRWRWKRHHTQNIDALPTPGWKQTARAAGIG
jgi:hypothetical protein